MILNCEGKREVNFFIIVALKLVAQGFRIRKMVFCYPEDILNTMEQ